jgi:3-methyladenine DNA glycosylase AlkD
MEEEKKAIVKKYCNNDPIYRLYFGDDNDTFVDELWDLCVEIIMKKYEFKSKNILYTFDLLRQTKDKKIKVVAIFFALSWETYIIDAIKDMYGSEGIFDKTHFDKFVGKMNEFTEKTIQFHYSKWNIVDTLTNYYTDAKKEYMMGPYNK